MNTQMHKDTARKFRALGHPMRLKLMQELIKGECCVGEVQKCLSVSQPNASQHLKILKEAELIESRRERKKICYRVSDDPMIKLIKNVLKENFNE